MLAENRRPDKAWIMAHLKRLGVQFSPLETGSGLYAKLLEATAEEKPADPLDHDGDGKKGGSKPKAAKKLAAK